MIRLNRSCLLFFVLGTLASPLARTEPYKELELTSRNLVLPEVEQFNLGSKLFMEKNKKLAAWKAYQTFLFNYPKNPQAHEAQFMLAESIFQKALEEYLSGNPPDELEWRRTHKSKLKAIGKGFKKSLGGLKNLGNTLAGESKSLRDMEVIDSATFSEAIEQFKKVVQNYRKTGLNDTALYRMAECFYNIGDYPSALQIFKSIVKNYPQSYLTGEAILGVAQCYIPGGDFGSADLEIKKLLTTYPSYAENSQVLFIQGIIRFQEGKYDEAVKHFEPIHTDESIFYLAQTLSKLNHFVSAAANYKKILNDFKDSHLAEQAAFLMADAFLKSENYAGSIQEFKKFTKDRPKSVLAEAALYRIGTNFFLKGDYSAARESFNLFLNTYPTGDYASLARYMVAESYRMTRQFKEANFAYGQVISLLPNAPITANAKFRLAWITYLQKDYSNASDLFQKFVDWYPFHAWVPYAYFLMGNSYVTLEKPNQAILNYQQAFDKSSKTELGEASMGLMNRAHYIQGNYGQLTSGYVYLLKSLPPSKSPWRAFSQLYLGDAYYRQNLYQEAIGVFENIAALYPNHLVTLQARDGLSWCNFQLGNYEEAQKQRRLIPQVRLPEGVLAPPITASDYELANAFFNQKKYHEALETYSKFIRQTPNSPSVPEALYRMGLCYYRQEFYTQAIENWEDLVAKHPNHERTEEAIFQIADTYFRAQKYIKAIETYRRIVLQYPENKSIGEAYLRIGQSYFNAGDDTNTLTELALYLKKYPNDPKATATLDLLEASWDRAETARKEISKTQGMQIFRSLISAHPASLVGQECQFRIARRFFNVQDYAQAAQDFEKLATDYPESPNVRESQFYAAECYYNLKQFTEATSAFERFLVNFPSSEFVQVAMFHKGTAQFNLERYDAAIESYRSLVQQFPDSQFASASLNNMALTQKTLLRLEDAADTYSKLALTFPADPYAQDALFEAGKIKRDLKQYAQAVLILKDLESKLPPNDERRLESLAIIAESYSAVNDADESLKTLKLLLENTPPQSPWKLEALRQMGEIYEKKESWSEAVSVYQEGGKFTSNPQVAASFRERANFLMKSYSVKPSKKMETQKRRKN